MIENKAWQGRALITQDRQGKPFCGEGSFPLTPRDEESIV